MANLLWDRWKDYGGENRSGDRYAEKQSPDEISKKISKMDKDEIMQKLDELDEKRIKELNIDLDKIKKKITPEDIEKAKKIAGKDGEVIINRLLELLKQGGK